MMGTMIVRMALMKLAVQPLVLCASIVNFSAILMTVFMKVGYVMEKMIAVMAQMKKDVVSIKISNV